MTTPKIIRLKACPCCGKTMAKPFRAHSSICSGDGWGIVCAFCGVRSRIYIQLADAVRRWNTRIVTDAETVFVNVDGVYVERTKEQ